MTVVSEPTAQQVILATILVFGIATACQVIAPKLRIPSLVLLLPAGFLLGIVAPNDTPATILGPVFPVAVDFVVAIILFHGGIGLSAIKLQPKDRSVVRRLVWIGAPLTGVLAAAAAHFIIGQVAVDLAGRLHAAMAGNHWPRRHCQDFGNASVA